MYHRKFRINYGENISREEYNTLLSEVTEYMVSKLLEGKIYKLPRQTGFMFIRASKRKMGGRPQISFGMTTIARREDPDAVVYVRNDKPSLKLAWFKIGFKAPYQSFTVFRPIRPVKHRIRDAAMSNKSYIILDGSKKNKHRQGNTGSSDGSRLPSDSVRNS